MQLVNPAFEDAVDGGTRRALSAGLVLALTAALLLLLPIDAFADGRIGSGPGANAGELGSETVGVAVNEQQGGAVYVADASGQRIDEFEPDGTFVRAFGWGVDASNPEPKLEVCTTATGCRVGSEGSGAGQFRWAESLAVDNDPASASYGDVYVVDQKNLRIEKFTPAGEFLLMFGSGVDKGPHHPGDVCTAQYVAEGDTCTTGTAGTGPAQFYEEVPQTDAGGRKSWTHEYSSSIAVGPAGKVYVGDFGRVQEFNSGGEYVGGLDLPDAEPSFVSALAVDAAGDIFERSVTYGNVEGYTEPIAEVPGVREYSSTHALLRTLDPNGAPTHLALDAEGDLFLSQLSEEEIEFQAYKPSGSLYAYFSSPLVEALNVRPEGKGVNTPITPRGIAVGTAAGDLYATSFREYLSGGNFVREMLIAVLPLPEPGPPTVKAGSQSAGDIEPTTATLHAQVNPDGFDTHYHFEYVTQSGFENGGFSNPATQSTAPTDLGLLIHDDPVQAAISGLEPETTYHFRVVAESSEGTVYGEDSTFTTLPPVSIREFTTQTVGPEAVTLKFELNPNGSSGRTFVRYGLDSTLVSGEAEEAFGTSNQFEAREVTFTGLKPNTTYLYQLRAENAYGEVSTTDQTFTTEMSGAEEREAEECPNGSSPGAPNSTLREENNSLALPDCRAYEQVSPKEKKGYPINPSFSHYLAPSGERDAFLSLGAFTGDTGEAQFVSHRTAAGWVTEASIGRALGAQWQPRGLIEYSAGLDRSLFYLVHAPTAGDAEVSPSPNVFYTGREGDAFSAASPVLEPLSGSSPDGFSWDGPVAQSADLSHLFLRTSMRILAEDPLGDASKGGDVNRIYEASSGEGTPTLRLVAEVPGGLTNFPEEETCHLDGAAGGIGGFGEFTNSTAADGSVLFYSSPVEVEAGKRCSGVGPNKYEIFACNVEAGPCAGPSAHASTELSAPPASECHSPSPCAAAPLADASFYGNSPDGSLAWFATTQPLVDSDTDNGNDLYLVRLEGGQMKELVLASRGEAGPGLAEGNGAGVQGVLGISQNGERIAFAATGVLSGAANPSTGETATKGADNVYVYDAGTGRTTFVARLCLGPESSGTVHDSSCPATLDAGTAPSAQNDHNQWRTGEVTGREAQLTPDGGFLLFTTWARLTSSDTDNALDVYRFDLATGALERISAGRRGNDANGNDSAFGAFIGGEGNNNQLQYAALDSTRSISSDGSVAIFSTAAPLVSQDTDLGKHPGCRTVEDTGCDVYEWEEDGHGTCTEAGGCISLVSSGLDVHGAADSVISASGRDINFITARGLVPGDSDGVTDVYDARVNGGFPFLPPEEPCRSGETCHGAPTSESLPINPVSESLISGGNGAQELHCARGRHKVRKHGQWRCVPNKHRKHRKRHRRHRPAARPNPGGNR